MSDVTVGDPTPEERPEPHTMFTLSGGLLGVEEVGCSCGAWGIDGPMTREEATDLHLGHLAEVDAR